MNMNQKVRGNFGKPGIGALPVAQSQQTIKIDDGPQKRDYRYGSRTRYNKSMNGSGIANLMNFETAPTPIENTRPVGTFYFLSFMAVSKY